MVGYIEKRLGGSFTIHVAIKKRDAEDHKCGIHVAKFVRDS